jgi:hypothetical protein
MITDLRVRQDPDPKGIFTDPQNCEKEGRKMVKKLSGIYGTR